SLGLTIGAKNLKGTNEKIKNDDETNLIRAEEFGKKIQLQAKIAEIEEKRLFEDFFKEQKKKVEIKAAELKEEKRLLEEKQIAEERETQEEKKNTEKMGLGKKSSVVSDESKTIKPSTGEISKKRVEKEKINNKETENKEEPAPARTDGFNFNGNHFSLAKFSGGGKVPAETNHVFQWTDKPDHYLIERVSPAGRAVTSVGVGTEIIINGTSYTVSNVERNIPNNDAGIDYLYKHNAAITFQTCERTKGSNGRSNLRFWYAR
ncbi:MAG: hypothetical protein L0L39_05950, partial [Atopostipes suicloacalis]|nr:hypothetical protein [Atopostipes suicloacalis]